MCYPALVGLAVAAVSAAGSIYTGNQRADAMEESARYNAALKRNKAAKIKAKGLEAEMAFRREVSGKVSRQRAQAAAGGVLANTGGVLQLQKATQTLGNADALRIRRNYADKAQALKSGANLTLLTGLNRAQNAATAGWVNGITSGISAGMGAYSAMGGTFGGGTKGADPIPVSRTNYIKTSGGYGSLYT